MHATITYIYAANDKQVFNVGCVVLLFSSNLSHGAKIVSLVKEGRACHYSKTLQHWEVANCLQHEIQYVMLLDFQVT